MPRPIPPGSDPSGTIAQPLKVLPRAATKAEDHGAILEAAREVGADTVVVGLPLTMEGEVGTAARKVISEVDELRRLAGGSLTVETQDERLSTVTAEAAMVEAGERRARRRQAVDQVAAAVFLQAWLDAREERA
jgi:putative Holliday junction resolvase